VAQARESRIRRELSRVSPQSTAFSTLLAATFLCAELDLLHDVIAEGIRVIDVGFGIGRQLFLLRDRLRLGVG